MDRTTPALRWKSSRRSQRAVGHVAQQTEPSYFLPPLGPQLASTAPHPPADRSRSPDRAPSAGSSGPHPAHTNELYTLIKGVNRLAHLPNESVQNLDPVMLAKRVIASPDSFHVMENETNQSFFLEIFQSALDDPQGRLGDQRPQVLLLLQDIVARSCQLPSRVRLLEIGERILITFGGEVFISKANFGGMTVIVRDARPPENQDWESLEGKNIMSATRREITTQIQVRHPHVLRVLGVSSSEDYPLSIVTPFAPNGNAFGYLKRLNSRQRAGDMLNIMRHIASALVYLHEMLPPLIHGDVDPRNILVDDEGNGLLSDFGLSRIKHEPTRTATVIVSGGKYRYLAPELLRVLTASGPGPFRTTAASDCYAFGMTFFELATLQKPFSEYGSEWEVSNAAMHGRQPEYPSRTAFGELSNGAIDTLQVLMRRTWAYEAVSRPSMREVENEVVNIASIHGREAAEAARHAFRAHQSYDTALAFANALKWYEHSLIRLGLRGLCDLDELCSSEEWRRMMPYFTIYAYIAEKAGYSQRHQQVGQFI